MIIIINKKSERERERREKREVLVKEKTESEKNRQLNILYFSHSVHVQSKKQKYIFEHYCMSYVILDNVGTDFVSDFYFFCSFYFA